MEREPRTADVEVDGRGPDIVEELWCVRAGMVSLMIRQGAQRSGQDSLIEREILREGAGWQAREYHGIVRSPCERRRRSLVRRSRWEAVDDCCSHEHDQGQSPRRRKGISHRPDRQDVPLAILCPNLPQDSAMRSAMKTICKMEQRESK